jgi:hypothetical protein
MGWGKIRNRGYAPARRRLWGLAASALAAWLAAAPAPARAEGDLQKFLLTDDDIEARCQGSKRPELCRHTYEETRDRAARFLDAQRDAEQRIRDFQERNGCNADGTQASCDRAARRLAELTRATHRHLADTAFDSAGRHADESQDMDAAAEDDDAGDDGTDLGTEEISGGNGVGFDVKVADAPVAAAPHNASGSSSMRGATGHSSSHHGSSHHGSGHHGSGHYASGHGGSSHHGDGHHSGHMSSSHSHSSHGVEAMSLSSGYHDGEHDEGHGEGEHSWGNGNSSHNHGDDDDDDQVAEAHGLSSELDGTFESLGRHHSMMAASSPYAAPNDAPGASPASAGHIASLGAPAPYTTAGRSPASVPAPTSSHAATGGAAPVFATVLPGGAPAYGAYGSLAAAGPSGGAEPAPDSGKDASGATAAGTATAADVYSLAASGTFYGSEPPAARGASDAPALPSAPGSVSLSGAGTNPWFDAMSNSESRRDFVTRLSASEELRREVGRKLHEEQAAGRADAAVSDFVRGALADASRQSARQRALAGLKPISGREDPFFMDKDETKNAVDRMMAAMRDEPQEDYLSSPTEPLFHRVHGTLSRLLRDGHVKRPLLLH